MSATRGDTLAVLGAINVDLVVRGSRLPAPGETVMGGEFSQHQGGKGGNQAVAAARALGDHGRVAMIGAVGPDTFGEPARELLAPGSRPTSRSSACRRRTSPTSGTSGASSRPISASARCTSPSSTR